MSFLPKDSLGLNLPAKLQDYAGFLVDPCNGDIPASSKNASRVMVTLLPEAEEMYDKRSVFQAALKSFRTMHPESHTQTEQKTHREIQYFILNGQHTKRQGETYRLPSSPSVACFSYDGTSREHLKQCASMLDGCLGYDDITAIATEDKYQIYVNNNTRAKFRCNLDRELADEEELQERFNQDGTVRLNQAEGLIRDESLWRGETLSVGEEGRRFRSPDIMWQDITAGTILMSNLTDELGQVPYYRTVSCTREWYSPYECDVFRRGLPQKHMLWSEKLGGYSVSDIMFIKDVMTNALTERYTSHVDDELDLVTTIKKHPEKVSEDWRKSVEGRIASLFPKMVDNGDAILKETLQEILHDKTKMRELKKKSKTWSTRGSHSMLNGFRRMSIGGRSTRSGKSIHSSRATTFQSVTSSGFGTSTGARSSRGTIESDRTDVTTATAFSPPSQAAPFPPRKTSHNTSAHALSSSMSSPPRPDTEEGVDDSEDDDDIPEDCRPPPFASQTTGRR